MAGRQDILTDENDDLLFIDGDLVIGQSDEQHVRHIFFSHAGQWKENPRVGFGASRFLKGNENRKDKFIRELKIQLKNDGYENPEIDLSRGIEKFKIKV